MTDVAALFVRKVNHYAALGTAREFLRLMHWCNWQDEISAAVGRAHPAFREQDAKLRRDAAYLIGYMA